MDIRLADDYFAKWQISKIRKCRLALQIYYLYMSCSFFVVTPYLLYTALTNCGKMGWRIRQSMLIGLSSREDM